MIKTTISSGGLLYDVIDAKEDTILHYNDCYWKVVRVGSREGAIDFYDCWTWSPTHQKWCTIQTYIIPANHPVNKIRIPGKLEILINLGVKAAINNDRR